MKYQAEELVGIKHEKKEEQPILEDEIVEE